MTDTVTIPREEYEALLQAREDLTDAQAYGLAMARNEDSFPAEVVKRILDGEPPLRVFREHRGMTQAALARDTGVNRIQIVNIEAGKRAGSVETMKKLARGLSVSLDDLVG